MGRQRLLDEHQAAQARISRAGPGQASVQLHAMRVVATDDAHRLVHFVGSVPQQGARIMESEVVDIVRSFAMQEPPDKATARW